MADKKITQLDSASALDGTENIVVVQSSSTKKGTVNDIKNYLIPTHITVSSGQTINLPSASSSTNRAIRFISNGGFNTNTRVHLTPSGSDTLDGSTSFYEINKEYEGIYVWCDGSEWFIIQKKA